MKRNMGRCLLGFCMVVSPVSTGSFDWIARLLGYIGISNGTALWQEISGYSLLIKSVRLLWLCLQDRRFWR